MRRRPHRRLIRRSQRAKMSFAPIVPRSIAISRSPRLNARRITFDRRLERRRPAKLQVQRRGKGPQHDLRQSRQHQRLGQIGRIHADGRSHLPQRRIQAPVQRPRIHHALLPGRQIRPLPVLALHLLEQAPGRPGCRRTPAPAGPAADRPRGGDGRTRSRTCGPSPGLRDRPHLDRLDVAAGLLDLALEILERLLSESWTRGGWRTRCAGSLRVEQPRRPWRRPRCCSSATRLAQPPFELGGLRGPLTQLVVLAQQFGALVVGQRHHRARRGLGLRRAPGSAAQPASAMRSRSWMLCP